LFTLDPVFAGDQTPGDGGLTGDQPVSLRHARPGREYTAVKNLPCGGVVAQAAADDQDRVACSGPGA
jgi:hypothetical protein